MVRVIKQIVSQEVINRRSFGFGNPVKYITIHQTGNPSKGADAQAHANIQTNMNPRVASWHYSVDDKVAIQSFPDEVRCWAATDGRGPGNMESVHIEICINSDGDYNKAIDNAAELVKVLKDKHRAEVKQHNDWYPKNCPAQLRGGYKGITWNDFLDMVDKPQVKSQQIKSYLSIGDKGKEVGVIQTKLRELGFYTGNIDDDFGPLTDAAVRDFQRVQKITVDGLVGSVTKSKLDSANTLPDGVYSLIKHGGQKLEAIKQIQTALNKANFNCGKADGYYGPATEDAVKRFQSMYADLTVDGIYGPNTKAKLE